MICLKTIKQSLKSLIYWLPLIYKWRPWDIEHTWDLFLHGFKAHYEDYKNCKYVYHDKKLLVKSKIIMECLKRLSEPQNDNMFHVLLSSGPLNGWCHCRDNYLCITVREQIERNGHILYVNSNVPVYTDCAELPVLNIDTAVNNYVFGNGLNWHICGHNRKKLTDQTNSIKDLLFLNLNKTFGKLWT